jgi:PST family polysaccharide transporter
MNILPKFIRNSISHRPNLLRIVENMGWLTLDKVVRMGVGLVIGIFVARHLGPEMFGALSFALAFVGIFAPIAGLGLREIVVRDLVSEPAQEAAILGTATALRALAGIAAYALIVAAIFLLRPDDALIKAMVMIVGVTVVVQTGELAAFWFEARVQSKYTVFAGLLSFLAGTAVRIVLLLQEAPVIAFAIIALVEAALATIALLFVFYRNGPGFSGLGPHVARAGQLLKDSWPLFLSGIAIVIYMRIDQVMLGQMFDDKAVGVYSVAVRISEVWYFLPVIITASLFPTIIATRKRNEAEYYAQLQRLFDLMVWLAIGIALPMMLLATPLVTLLFGPAYDKAGAVLAVHIWTWVFVFLGVASSKWFVVENRQLLSLQRTLLGALLNVVLNLVLIPRYGAIGAAWATLFAQAAAALVFDCVQPSTRALFAMKLRSFFPVHYIRKRT